MNKFIKCIDKFESVSFHEKKKEMEDFAGTRREILPFGERYSRG
jgi:hypothetical protein